MSNVVTKWVLELSDKMSGPINAAQERVKATGKEWARIGEHAGDSLKTISEQLKIEEKDLKEYQSTVMSRYIAGAIFRCKLQLR